MKKKHLFATAAFLYCISLTGLILWVMPDPIRSAGGVMVIVCSGVISAMIPTLILVNTD